MIAAQSPTKLVETRYEVNGYREAANPSIRHEALYVSPSMMPQLTKPKGNILETLTEKEQMVLSTIGDGSDDQEVAERLSLSPFTINTYRKTIMGKLDLHHKGQMMLYALQQGYVQVTPRGVVHPGFQRRISAITLAKGSVSEACE